MEGLGWHLYRIWSTDWFRRPIKEIERLVAAIDKAIESRSENTESSATVPLRITPEQTQTLHVNGNSLRVFVPQREAKQLVEQIPLKDEGIERLAIPYEEYHIPSYGGIMFTALPDGQLIDLVSRIVQHEAPIHLDEVARRLREAFGLERITTRILNITEVALRQAARLGGICCKGDFWFASGRQLERPRGRRHAAPSLRKHEKIAPEEYRLAISAALRESFSAERGELTASVARVLGFDRTGNGLESSISDEIDWMLKAGTIGESGGRLEAK